MNGPLPISLDQLGKYLSELPPKISKKPVSERLLQKERPEMQVYIDTLLMHSVSDYQCCDD